jgi:hypothetical protein
VNLELLTAHCSLLTIVVTLLRRRWAAVKAAVLAGAELTFLRELGAEAPEVDVAVQ